MALRRWLGRLQGRLEARARVLASGEAPPAAAAEAEAEAGSVSEIIVAARRALAAAPNDPGLALALVQALAGAGRPAEAALAAREGAEVARRMGAHEIELECCALWLAQEPQSADARIARAHALAAAGRAAEAAAEYEAVLAAHGPQLAVLLRLGAVYHDMVRPQDAHRTYLQAVQLEPDNVDALCVAGMSARDLGETAQAEAFLARAQAAAPDSAHATFNLGLVRLDQGRIAEASEAFRDARALNRGAPWREAELAAHLAAGTCDPNDRDWGASRFKLAHDIQQLEYLRAAGRLGPAFDPVLVEYRYALTDRRLPEDPYTMVGLDPRRYPLLAATYKRPLYAPDPEPPQGPLVNPDLPWAELEQRYLDAKPNMVWIDGLLTPAALAAVRAYCMESTIWNDLKGGYLGAYMHDGFAGRLLLGISAELRARMPRVIRERPLQTMWGYKYDSRYSGTGVHADVAAVNVNFWVTPDEANLDPDSGGLIVHAHEAPRDWGFQRFNMEHEEIYKYLDSVGSRAVKIPYRANRAVIFDSDLFHETDAFRFRDGYADRRINVTMLYGTREG